MTTHLHLVLRLRIIGAMLLQPYKTLRRGQKQIYLYMCKFANIGRFCCRTDKLEYKQQWVIPHPIYPMCTAGFFDMETSCSDSTHVQGQHFGRSGDDGATCSRNVCYGVPVDTA